MFLNALHIRLGLIGVGVVLLGVYFLFGGSLGAPQVIQLDFSMYPEVFEGCQVEIDGEIVGKLEPYGQATRSGFKVNRGDHVVRVLHPDHDSESLKVAVDSPGQKVRVLLDLTETRGRGGESGVLITMNRM